MSLSASSIHRLKFLSRVERIGSSIQELGRAVHSMKPQGRYCFIYASCSNRAESFNVYWRFTDTAAFAKFVVFFTSLSPF